MDPSKQVDFARTIRGLSDEQLEDFSWSGVPSPGQAKAVLQMAFEHLVAPKTQTYTSFDTIWAQLQSNREHSESLSDAVDAHEPYSKNRTSSLEETLKFKRQWMSYEIPSLLKTAQNIDRKSTRLNSSHWE